MSLAPRSIPFLITGLPRSRTAWLAAAANLVPSARCWHEPLQWLERWEDVFTEVWGRLGASYVGISDHALGFHLAEILERASPRVLIVERPVEEVERAVTALGIDPGRYCQLLYDALSVKSPLVRRVAFKDLKQSYVVVEALEWLMPGVEIDSSRVSMLQSFNIQSYLPEARRVGAQCSFRADALLGAGVMAKLREAAL